MSKSLIAAKFPKANKKFSPFVWNIIACLTGNATFGNLPITLQMLTDEATAFDKAAAADKRTAGATQDRDSKRSTLEDDLRVVEAYLQSVVSKLPPDAAAAAILSSGFAQKNVFFRTKEAYTVERTRKQTSGNVTINIKSLGRHGTLMYCHQYSLNNGQTWIDCIPTNDTRFVIAGLPVGTIVSFRFRMLIKGAYGDWSQTLTYLVH